MREYMWSENKYEYIYRTSEHWEHFKEIKYSKDDVLKTNDAFSEYLRDKKQLLASIDSQKYQELKDFCSDFNFLIRQTRKNNDIKENLKKKFPITKKDPSKEDAFWTVEDIIEAFEKSSNVLLKEESKQLIDPIFLTENNVDYVSERKAYLESKIKELQAQEKGVTKKQKKILNEISSGIPSIKTSKELKEMLIGLQKNYDSEKEFFGNLLNCKNTKEYYVFPLMNAGTNFESIFISAFSLWLKKQNIEIEEENGLLGSIPVEYFDLKKSNIKLPKMQGIVDVNLNNFCFSLKNFALDKESYDLESEIDSFKFSTSKFPNKIRLRSGKVFLSLLLVRMENKIKEDFFLNQIQYDDTDTVNYFQNLKELLLLESIAGVMQENFIKVMVFRNKKTGFIYAISVFDFLENNIDKRYLPNNFLNSIKSPLPTIKSLKTKEDFKELYEKRRGAIIKGQKFSNKAIPLIGSLDEEYFMSY